MERLRDEQVELMCANCSAELAQEYCSRCGQRRIHPQDLSAYHFLRELAGKVANFHAKFKTLRTLRALLIPGLLTAKYLAGRRQPYRSPFKLYLVCAAIFFVSAPVAGFRLASMLESDPSGPLSRLVSARAAERALDRPLFNARFDIRVQPIYTATLGTVAIAFALMLQLLFGKEDKPYGAHLTFALHYVSFMYLVTIAAGASRTIGVSMGTATIAGYALLVPYLILALKRVYSERTGEILLKAGALLLLSFAFNNVAAFAAIRLTLALD